MSTRTDQSVRHVAPGRWKCWACGLLLASSQLLMPAAADETPGNLYYPYVPADSWDSVMINGPKCLGTMQESIQIGSLDCESDIHKNFLDTLHHWRTERRIYVGYDGRVYPTLHNMGRG